MEGDRITLWIDHLIVLVMVCLFIGYQVGAFIHTLDERQREHEQRYWAKRRSMRNHPTHKGRTQ
ncbi:hypothetical protein uvFWCGRAMDCOMC493_014 [Freshwater phage uvFW-CGR-AMD-COM-C493]|nr:hypothetical protein uvFWCGRAMDCOMC493_014 [Freshwater phage uvFW-CGR-AMD-COM-C493]